MNGKVNSIYTAFAIVLISVVSIDCIVAQQKLGDNLGNHTATKNLDMNNYNLNNVQVINAENVVIGTVGAITNSSISLQVNGSNQTILIPRVTGLLNTAGPAIPAANAVEGMIVFDLTTHKFYVRNNSLWMTYGTGKLANGRIFIGDASGVAQQVNVSGDITLSNTGVTAIGSNKIVSAMYANNTVTGAKIVNGSANQYLTTNASGGTQWITVDRSKYVDAVSRQDNIKGHKTFTSDTGFVAGGTFGTGILPVSTTGVRMMWYPAKGAFRAGNLSANGILDANIGNYSAAFGDGSIASGSTSFATGSSTASGELSVALGKSKAEAIMDFASGTSTANGKYSAAMGAGSVASDTYSVAMGKAASVGSTYALALGENVIAGGFSAVSLGRNNNNAGYGGTFIFSDASTPVITIAYSARFVMRFSGGYKLFSDALSTVGVSMAAGANGWSQVSDKRKKENFERVNHESFLAKIDTLALGSWNYKGQDAKKWRHYGPMAQDFYAAFGKDSFGKIGNDTTIAGGDMDGVIMIGLQAISKRSNTINSKKEQLAIHHLELNNKVQRSGINNQAAGANLKIELEQISRARDLELRELENELIQADEKRGQVLNANKILNK